MLLYFLLNFTYFWSIINIELYERSGRYFGGNTKKACNSCNWVNQLQVTIIPICRYFVSEIVSCKTNFLIFLWFFLYKIWKLQNPSTINSYYRTIQISVTNSYGFYCKNHLILFILNQLITIHCIYVMSIAVTLLLVKYYYCG